MPLMGWQSNIFPLLIVNASGGFTGLFVYSPGPGPGNLIGSVTAGSGTDPYGNTYQAGIVSYGAAGQYTALQSSNIVAGDATGVIAAFYAVRGFGWGTTGNLNSADPAGPAIETWHTVGAVGQPAFGAGFSSTGGAFAPVGFQYEAIAGGRVRLRGQMTLTANVVALATAFILPPAYRPVSQQIFSKPSTFSGGFNNGFVVQVVPAGNIQVIVADSTGNIMQLDDTVIELN